jgi:trans-aconitate methyltransferase
MGSSGSRWDAAYAQGEATRSWFEPEPGMSLRMLHSAGVSAADPVIDVGGGASLLAQALLDRGFRDVTVLDVSDTGMQYARRRLGPRAGHVTWLAADVLAWSPGRQYQAWHDRAVFHFLTVADQRRDYLRALGAATGPGAVAVFGCFAPDGPDRCSGLPVARYSAAQLAGELGRQWHLVSQDRQEHVTPAGAVQPFTWAALRKQDPAGTA